MFGYADAPDTAPRTWAKAAPRKEGFPTLFALDRSNGRAKWVRGGKPDDPLGASLYPPLAIGDGRVYVRSGTTLAALDAATGATAWSVADLDSKDEETWWEGVAHDGKLYLYQFNIRTYGAKAALSTRVFAAKDGARLGEKKRGDADVYFSSQEKVCRTPPGAGTAAGCIYATAAGNCSSSAATAMPSKGAA